MRISHQHKFIFLSKPRCASESIRAMLDSYSDIKSSQKAPYYHHASALELKRHFERIGWKWEEYFKFISIRNPWDMMVSVYHYSKPDINGVYFWHANKKDKHYHPDKPIDFDQWIKNYSFYFWSLKRFSLDENGHSLVDLIIKVEDLETGLNQFFVEVGLPPLTISHINKTRHDNYRKYYTAETREKVARVFEYDIEVGKYTF